MEQDVDLTPVIDPLKQIEQRGHTRFDVFTDWLDLMLYALQGRDDPYLELVGKYSGDRHSERGTRSIDLFSEAFGQLMSTMETANCDILGQVYETLGMNSSAFGQHFTPSSVSTGAAGFLDAADSADRDGPTTIADPACGSGRLLIQAARRVDGRVFVYGHDNDDTCAKMAALNGCFFNMDGVWVHGDSLELTAHHAWKTAFSGLGGSITEVDPDEIPLEAPFKQDTADQDAAPKAATSAAGESNQPAAEDQGTATDGGTGYDRVTVSDGDGFDQGRLEEWLEE